MTVTKSQTNKILYKISVFPFFLPLTTVDPKQLLCTRTPINDVRKHESVNMDAESPCLSFHCLHRLGEDGAAEPASSSPVKSYGL